MNLLNVKVRRIKMHASYDTANTDHDIALIEMDRPVDFSHGVRPVCLPDEDATFVGEPTRYHLRSYNFSREVSTKKEIS